MQFERTLIIAEEGSYVSYLEGCTAPAYDTNQVSSCKGCAPACLLRPRVARTVFFFGRISENVTRNVLPLSTTRGSHFNKFSQKQKQ